MGWKVIQDAVVPRCSGKTARVNRGQVFRLIEYEGKQVCDLTFLNAHNYTEHFSAELSAQLNSFQGMGGYHRITRLYSKPPYENIMATVMDDPVGNGVRGGERGGHYIDDGHCTNRLLEFAGFPGARTCSDNFRDAYAEIALRQEDTFDSTIFNVWMNAWTEPDGTMIIGRPYAETGDYIDFLAEMDLMAVFSACPFEASPCNDYRAKALRFQVLEWEGGERTMGWSKDLKSTDAPKPA